MQNLRRSWGSAPVRRSSLGSGPTLGHLSYSCFAGPSRAFPRGDSADSHMENRNGLLKGYSSIKAGGLGRGAGGPFKCLLAIWLSGYVIKMLKEREARKQLCLRP